MSSTTADQAAGLAARAAAVIPGGVNSGQRQVPGLEDLIIAGTSGSTFTDGNGRTYTDYHAAFGHEVLGIAVDGLTPVEQREVLERFAADVAPVLRREIPSRPLGSRPLVGAASAGAGDRHVVDPHIGGPQL